MSQKVLGKRSAPFAKEKDLQATCKEPHLSSKFSFICGSHSSGVAGNGRGLLTWRSRGQGPLQWRAAQKNTGVPPRHSTVGSPAHRVQHLDKGSCPGSHPTSPGNLEGLGVAQWQSKCLACMGSSVQSPVHPLNKSKN